MKSKKEAPSNESRVLIPPPPLRSTTDDEEERVDLNTESTEAEEAARQEAQLQAAVAVEHREYVKEVDEAIHSAFGSVSPVARGVLFDLWSQMKSDRKLFPIVGTDPQLGSPVYANAPRHTPRTFMEALASPYRTLGGSPGGVALARYIIDVAPAMTPHILEHWRATLGKISRKETVDTPKETEDGQG